MTKIALNIDGETVGQNAPGALYQIETEDSPNTDEFVRVIKEGAKERGAESARSAASTQSALAAINGAF